MSTSFVRYEPATGEVVEVGIMSVEGIDHLTEQMGWCYLRGTPASLDDYVDLLDLKIRPRPNLQVNDNYTITADGVDTLTVHLPVEDATLLIDGVAYSITDGEVIFTTHQQGIYQMELSAFPYSPKRFMVTADAPNS